MAERSELTNPSRPLAGLALPGASGGAPVPVCPRGRRASVIVLAHPAGCEGCRDYLRRLAGIREEIEEWDGRVVVVRPGSNPGGDASGEGETPPFPELVDGEGRLAGAVSADAPAVVVADQWAEVHAVEEAGADHAFPEPAELVSWLRYLATRCPECEGEAL